MLSHSLELLLNIGIFFMGIHLQNKKLSDLNKIYPVTDNFPYL